MHSPLVSVPVITYNSSEYIIEGLESIKAQTYQNIELIISDDNSSDNTVELCRIWIENNKSRFVRAIIITSDKNTGVAGNCNRAIRTCNGEWIKMLSGDDLFFPNTIEDYVNYILLDHTINICFAKLKFLGDKNERSKKIISFYETLFKEIENPKRQYIRYLKHHYIPGTGLFYKKQLWAKVGGFNEDYPFCEEYPFNLVVLEKGETIHYIDKELYGYTIRNDSLSNGEKPVWRNFRDQRKFFFDIKLKKMLRYGLFLYAYEDYTFYYRTKVKYFDKPTKVKILFADFLRMISPLTLLRKINLYKF